MRLIKDASILLLKISVDLHHLPVVMGKLRFLTNLVIVALRDNRVATVRRDDEGVTYPCELSLRRGRVLLRVLQEVGGASHYEHVVATLLKRAERLRKSVPGKAAEKSG